VSLGFGMWRTRFQEIDDGGKSVASHPGYHADAMTSEPSVALVVCCIPPAAREDPPGGGLREQYWAADATRGATSRNGNVADIPSRWDIDEGGGGGKKGRRAVFAT
jgi:hypothetical protein